jgi:hypothetical protein
MMSVIWCLSSFTEGLTVPCSHGHRRGADDEPAKTHDPELPT